MATLWKTRAVFLWDCAMQLLNLVSDGSYNSGVEGFSTVLHFVSQYVFIARRHFDASYSNNAWLRHAFDFYYYTVAPGFQRTVGIADSDDRWHYGPEHQLTFLDSFIVRNGQANWLAAKIRRHSPIISRNSCCRHAGLHLEFLWYNASLSPVAPILHNDPESHLFDQWGVVTYRSGSIDHVHSTYLSFKSGKLHGAAIYDLIQRTHSDELIYGWDTFHCSKEHPDQNSFTFAPNGEEFITEGLIGKKYTFLDNVLMFGPIFENTCAPSWIGQLGDCEMWLRCYDNQENGKTKGKIIANSHSQGIVFLSGEAVEAYPVNLRLSSVYRSLLLLNENLLLVVDHITLNRSQNSVSAVSAFFNNNRKRFIPHRTNRGLNGVQMTSKDGAMMGAFWVSWTGDSPVANVTEINTERPDGKTNNVSNVNVTFDLNSERTAIAYVFHGSSDVVTHINIVPSNESWAVVTIVTEKWEYNVQILLDYRKTITQNFYSSYYKFLTKLITDFPSLPSNSSMLALVKRNLLNDKQFIVSNYEMTVIIRRINVLLYYLVALCFLLLLSVLRRYLASNQRQPLNRLIRVLGHVYSTSREGGARNKIAQL